MSIFKNPEHSYFKARPSKAGGGAGRGLTNNFYLYKAEQNTQTRKVQS